jgi:hypothetical protein
MRAFVIVGLLGSVVAAAASWPPPFVEVRGYSYNRIEPPSGKDSTGRRRMYYPLFEDGRLTDTVINKAGARLATNQVQRLLKAITGKHPEHLHARCFNPHHGFAFYDASNKAVAWIEVCFECGNTESWPEGRKVSEDDMHGLLALCNELKLPRTP